MGNEPTRKDGGFVYLMQFTDGNRIDLTLLPVDHIDELQEDSLSILLLDKDNRFKPFPSPDESSYLPAPPTQKAYDDCCNEFLWVSPYVAKGLARGDILYAKHMLDVVLREQLMKMLTWLFGVRTNFTQNPGKQGKHFKDVFSETLWGDILQTYSDADIAHTWQSLLIMLTVFEHAAQEVGEVFHFSYPAKDAERVTHYLRRIHNQS